MPHDADMTVRLLKELDRESTAAPAHGDTAELLEALSACDFDLFKAAAKWSRGN